jgi:transposase
MNANLIFKWLKDPRFQSDGQATEEPAFLPVEIFPEPETGPEAALPNLPQSVPVPDSCIRSGPRIEIVTAHGHRVNVEGDFDADALARLLKGLVS